MTRGRKKALRRMSLALWALGFCGFFAFFPRPAGAQQLISNFTSGDVSWPSSRHVFYDHGIGQVFVFYSQPYGIAYRSYNFSSWSSESVVISTGNALALDPAGATNSNTMYSSVYYDQASSSVYVIASDPNVLLEVNNPYNSVFMIKGAINSDGTISWGSLVQKSFSGKVSNCTGECAPGMNVGITYMKGAASPVAFTCDAQCINGTGGGNPAYRVSLLGMYGLSSALGGGTMYSADNDFGNNINNTSPANKNYGQIVPVNDSGSGYTYDFVLAQHYPGYDNFALRVESLEYTGTKISREIYQTGSTPANPSVTHSLAPQPDSVSSIIAMGYIDSTGELGYQERTAANTWSGETVIDACAGSITTPCGTVSPLAAGCQLATIVGVGGLATAPYA